MIQILFSGEKLSSTSPQAFSLFEKSRLGEKKNKKIEYLPVEALFLLEKNKASLLHAKKDLAFEDFLQKAKRKDKKIETKYLVYKNLRKRGYVPKTALKFGAEFRVYKKGSGPGKDHAPWLLQTFKETDSIKWHEFSAKNRIAHSTRKTLLLAIVDDEDSITYYEVNWKKP